MTIRNAATALILLTAPGAAWAQEAVPVASAEPPLCTDRPTKSNAVCTVPEGTVQLETDFFNWTRLSDAGTRVTTVQVPVPTLKYGIGPNTDVQATIAPYVRITARAGGTRDSIDGVGDLTLRLKQRVTDPAATLQIGVIPFVKVPTARRGIGNREWEGGIAMPVQYSLPAGVTLTAGPEVDLLHDADGRGTHLQYVGTVNVGKALSPTLTLYGELWTAQNDDPEGTIEQYSADVALAWLVRPRLQLDVGGNFGLNRAAPDAQLYVGLSTRF